MEIVRFKLDLIKLFIHIYLQFTWYWADVKYEERSYKQLYLNK